MNMISDSFQTDTQAHPHPHTHMHRHANHGPSSVPRFASSAGSYATGLKQQKGRGWRKMDVHNDDSSRARSEDLPVALSHTSGAGFFLIFLLASVFIDSGAFVPP